MSEDNKQPEFIQAFMLEDNQMFIYKNEMYVKTSITTPNPDMIVVERIAGELRGKDGVVRWFKLGKTKAEKFNASTWVYVSW